MKRSFLLRFLMLLLAALPLAAQTSTGEIDITVLDPTGAVIPNTKITVTGSETGNLVRTVTTNQVGLAAAPLLPPGTYNIGVTATGFEGLSRKGIVLHVGDVLNLRLSLKTGNVSETVEVVGETPMLEEKSVTLGHVMEQKEMAQLPLNGRNYLDLGRLVAGTVPSRGSRDQTFSAYGNSGLQNAFLMDGARNENYLRGLDNRARDMLRPPLDAVAEFQVQTSNFSAEFGASAGAVVSAITRSGTNQIHGSAYDFLRNDKLDASNFFADPDAKPLLVQNQYGGSIGAPIKKDRAWVFGAYEGTHNRSESVGFATVPTADMLAGNFGSTAVYDPLSTVPNPNGSGWVRTQFPNNIIPASRFDKLGQEIAGYYPAQNRPGLANNYTRNNPLLTANHNLVARGDIQVSARDTMFVRGSMVRQTLSSNTVLPEPAQTGTDRNVNSAGIGYGYTRTFSNTTVNEFRFSWTRMTLDQDIRAPLNEIIPGMLDPRIQHGEPTFAVTGFAQIGAQPGNYGNSPMVKSSGVWDISDNVSRMMGRHQLKFGVDVQAIRPSTLAGGRGRGGFGFTGVFTQNPQKRPGTGSAVADLLLGDANSLTTGGLAESIERGHYAGGYIQDQWTLTSSLTLNLGLRYEIFPPYVETQDRLGNFVLDPGDPNYGKLVMAGVNGISRGIIATDTNNWAPRVGIAWRVPGVKGMVVRSSYGIFYGQDQGNGVNVRMTNNPPFFSYGGLTLTSDQLDPSTGYVMSSGIAAPRPAPITGAQFVLNPKETTTLISWDPRYTTPYVQEWNFSVQKQLPWNMVWETSYVGNKGTHIWGQTQGNQPLTNGPGAPNTRRPLAQYTIAPITAFSPWDSSSYEGISTHVEKRFSSGLSFVASFNYGRSIDYQNQALDVQDGNGNGNNIQDSYNRNAQRGVSDNNVPLRVSFGGTWQLPFGNGHSLLSHGIAAKLAGSWEVSGIYSAQSGLPFTTNLNFDNANSGNTNYPNRTCDGNISNHSLSRWFDTSCFSAPAQYQFGNEGRNVLVGPGKNNLDFGVHRRFHIPWRESAALEFRGEAFNLFNHPQFGIPGSTLGNPGFGIISGTSEPNRILQMALRFTF
ncbi:MAG: carboxypeptidase regulatory-like domain-containing protein [Acidobacteria bacterium]|nr:carboxypeptidase regulatory-like domain-containing protein [Acidobacteriota bacterium]